MDWILLSSILHCAANGSIGLRGWIRVLSSSFFLPKTTNMAYCMAYFADLQQA